VAKQTEHGSKTQRKVAIFCTDQNNIQVSEQIEENGTKKWVAGYLQLVTLAE
jgi:hypothetical protein